MLTHSCKLILSSLSSSLLFHPISPLLKKLALDHNKDYCETCNGIGEFLCCETCPVAMHFICADPPVLTVPEGDWFCRNCTDKKKVMVLPPRPSSFPSPSCRWKIDGAGTGCMSSLASLTLSHPLLIHDARRRRKKQRVSKRMKSLVHLTDLASLSAGGILPSLSLQRTFDPFSQMVSL